MFLFVKPLRGIEFSRVTFCYNNLSPTANKRYHDTNPAQRIPRSGCSIVAPGCDLVFLFHVVDSQMKLDYGD
jgi:hypothetical protein